METTCRLRSSALFLTLLISTACSENKPSEAPAASAPPAAPASASEYGSAPAASQPAASSDPAKIEALKEIARGDAALPAGHPPVTGGAPMGDGAPAAAGAAPGAAAPQGALPTAGGPLTVADVRFTPPEGWRFVHPSSQMRRAQWEIPGAAGAGEAVVYFFGPGQGGGVDDNVSRWLAQITPVAGAAPEPKARESRETGGVKLTTVRARGTYNPGTAMGAQAQALPDWAMVGLILESPGGPVFLKITGPAATIDASSAGIDALAASVELIR